MQSKSQTETSENSFMLAPSKTHGVGVFATHVIKKNTKLRLFTERDPRYIPYKSEELNAPLVKKFCEWYCVQDKEGYFCPIDFGHMEVGWYLNHSKSPNAYHIEYIYYALNDINEGDEILIDYDTLEEQK